MRQVRQVRYRIYYVEKTLSRLLSHKIIFSQDIEINERGFHYLNSNTNIINCCVNNVIHFGVIGRVSTLRAFRVFCLMKVSKYRISLIYLWQNNSSDTFVYSSTLRYSESIFLCFVQPQS